MQPFLTQSLLAAALLLLAACTPPSAGTPGPLELERELQRLAAEHGGGADLWPEFELLAVPLAVYDGEHTYLFRHPAPPAEFVPLSPQDTSTHLLVGRHPAVIANSYAEIGGVVVAMILFDAVQTPRALAAVAAHEAFHVYQRARHPGWEANEMDLLIYPVDSAELLALRRQETEALSRALAQSSGDDTACWARLALAAREQRFAQMQAPFAAYERGTELNEGLANYVQMRAEGSGPELPENGFPPAQVRSRAYASGAALAILLQSLAPDWQRAMAAGEHASLDQALAAVVGSGEACAFDGGAVAGMQSRARRDTAALAAERAQRAESFEARAGWRLLLEVSGEPLWPQGFDPLNIEPLADNRLLHTRFLRLGNSSGSLELMGGEALSEGAGSHPLFQGVRSLLLTGLEELQVTETGGRIKVQTQGLTLEFTGASIAKSEGAITLRLAQ